MKIEVMKREVEVEVQKDGSLVNYLKVQGFCDSVEKKISILDNKEKINTLLHELVHMYLNFMGYSSGEEGLHTEKNVIAIAYLIENMILDGNIKLNINLDDKK